MMDWPDGDALKGVATMAKYDGDYAASFGDKCEGEGLVVGASFLVACPLVQVIIKTLLRASRFPASVRRGAGQRNVRWGGLAAWGWRRETLAIEVMFAPYSNIACRRDSSGFGWGGAVRRAISTQEES